MDPNHTLGQRREDRDHIGMNQFVQNTEQQVSQALTILANFQQNYAQMHAAILRQQLEIYTAWAKQAENISRVTQENQTNQNSYRQQQGQF